MYFFTQFIGRHGVIVAIHDSEDIVVRYSNNKILQLNPVVLTKVYDTVCLINFVLKSVHLFFSL